jgi:hypothetical protein
VGEELVLLSALLSYRPIVVVDFLFLRRGALLLLLLVVVVVHLIPIHSHTLSHTLTSSLLLLLLGVAAVLVDVPTTTGVVLVV